ncbi:MAG: flavin reductase family protein [Gammaproteobacteria bacterium]|nr:flavin reductase family protein [Gammaproteobacteria bacterium]
MTLSKQEFRSAMSLFPTGVAIITSEPEGYSAFGMTVNSFTSLSLDPPLVMWNLQKSSDTYKAWHDAETFAVNFLSAGQQELSSQYARKGEHDLEPAVMERGITGCPLLADCLASLECKMHARNEEGDHVIIIGEVVAVLSQPDTAPLVFHNGAYTELK